MDQDAFRQLVTNSSSNPSRTAGIASGSRGSLLPSRSAKKAEVVKNDATKSEFKPRKVKKNAGPGYRDRAAERRGGVAGDFAHAEELLEKFEQQHADDEDRIAVEEKRRYLGGDLEHTVLVKGLDYALLEQMRAREAAKSNAEDDELLETAIRAVTEASTVKNTSSNASNSTKGSKRTREDIIRELKEKRGQGGTLTVDNEGIEKAKQEGKFKPIGFKPIGGAKNVKESVKKKIRKVDATGTQSVPAAPKGTQSTSNDNVGDSEPSTSIPYRKQSHQSEVLIDDDDIFADAGDYEGLILEDEESGEEGEEKEVRLHHDGVDNDRLSTKAPGKWFDDEDDMDVEQAQSRLPVGSSKDQDKGDHLAETSRQTEKSDQQPVATTDEVKRVARLTPLQSSMVPSIRDILAADDALEAEDRRRARKEKRKAGGDLEDGEVKKKKVSAETKLNREYKKLKAYTDKKDQQ